MTEHTDLRDVCIYDTMKTMAFARVFPSARQAPIRPGSFSSPLLEKCSLLEIILTERRT